MLTQVSPSLYQTQLIQDSKPNHIPVFKVILTPHNQILEKKYFNKLKQLTYFN